MKVVRNLFQLMERYDGCGGDVRCDNCQEMGVLSDRGAKGIDRCVI